MAVKAMVLLGEIVVLLSPSYLNSKVNMLLPVAAAHPCSTPRSSSRCHAVLHMHVFPCLGLASFLHTWSSSCAKLLKTKPPNPDLAPKQPSHTNTLKKEGPDLEHQFFSFPACSRGTWQPTPGRRCLPPLWAHGMRMLMLLEGVTEFCSFLYPARAFCCFTQLVIALKKPREGRK